MGGKTHSDNDRIVEEQKRQAEEAARKEAERQARIKSGLQQIGWAFEGRRARHDVKQAFDWKNFTPKTVLPKGYTRTYVDAKGNILEDQPATTGHYEQQTGPLLGSAHDTRDFNGQVWVPGHAAVTAADIPGAIAAIVGPDGKVIMPGKNFTYTASVPFGPVKGGFNNAFYNEYGKAIRDYYDPQVATQYGDAQKELTYRLARAGTLQSSGASDETVRLAQQYTDNLAAIANKADTATGQLKAQVAGEKAKAINQLYATENPEVAANQATAAVRDITLQRPDLSPLAQLFNIAAIGGANIMRGINNNRLIGDFQQGLPSGSGSGHVVESS